MGVALYRRSQTTLQTYSVLHIIVLSHTSTHTNTLPQSEYMTPCCLSTVDGLRVQWDAVEGKVSLRKIQLEDMLLECRQWDEMRAELEWWLSQIEEEFDTQGQGGDTVDELQKQIQDHKVSDCVDLK